MRGREKGGWEGGEGGREEGGRREGERREGGRGGRERREGERRDGGRAGGRESLPIAVVSNSHFATITTYRAYPVK